jgi:hypothetical protein
MAEYHIENNLRMSSSGFLWGTLVHTTYKTACLRKVLLQSQTIQGPVDSKYRDLGQKNEDRHAERLTKAGRRFQREVEFIRPTHSRPAVSTSGHCDFLVLHGEGSPWRIDELKSVSSQNVARKVIRDGSYPVENLAQTVRYMVEAKVVHGRFIYTQWKKGEPVDERIFRLHIDDYGRIAVDDLPTQFVVYDLLAFEDAAAEVIEERIVWDRPFRGEIPFAGACHWCPFKTACDAWDAGSIKGTDAFVDFAKSNIVEEKEDG